MQFKLIKTCETCKFNFNGVCVEHDSFYGYGGKIEKILNNCNEWYAGLDYVIELEKTAPWYIVDDFIFYKISLYEFLELAEKEHSNQEITINLFDAIEKTYNLPIPKLANILNVSEGVILYAKNRGTPKKRLLHFSSTLCIPEEFFYKFTNKNIHELEKCYTKFLKKYPMYL